MAKVTITFTSVSHLRWGWMGVITVHVYRPCAYRSFFLFRSKSSIIHHLFVVSQTSVPNSLPLPHLKLFSLFLHIQIISLASTERSSTPFFTPNNKLNQTCHCFRWPLPTICVWCWSGPGFLPGLVLHGTRQAATGPLTCPGNTAAHRTGVCLGPPRLSSLYGIKDSKFTVWLQAVVLLIK